MCNPNTLNIKMIDERKVVQNKVKKNTLNRLTNETNTTDNEEPKLLFNKATIRRAFSLKVFTILTILLAKTVTFSAFCMYYGPLKNYWEDNPITILYPIPLYFICALGIIFKPSVRRRTPWNYINLFIFSTCICIAIGGICAIYAEETILIGFSITTVLVLALAIFAFQTKWDFTELRMYGLSFILAIILIFLTSLAGVHNGLKLIGACLGVITFSIYLIVDIQQIISGDHAFKISPEDHILAVTILYLDIINIFLNILKMLK